MVGAGVYGEGADSVNGILLGHPFTRTRRKLEDLIWRVVWIAFAPAMPPIEPSVIYVHIHTYYARISIHTRRGGANMSESMHARDAAAPVCVRVYTLHVRRVRTMYTKEQFTRERSSFVRSFVLSFARSLARSLVCVYICAP